MMSSSVNCGEALEFLSHIDTGSVDLLYMDPPFNTGRDFGAYKDTWPSTKAYIDWLREYVLHAARVLCPDTGNFVLHLDWRAVHYAKVLCDAVFNDDQFRNEVIWCYASGGASKKHLSRKHDTLLWYSMSDAYTFNVIREPYPHNYGDRPGFHPDGRMLTDWWQIPFLSTNAKERTGYPTQKPLALLKRVIELWSDVDDIVVDPMCGSGTTAVAANELGRRFHVNDISHEAVEIVLKRLGIEG